MTAETISAATTHHTRGLLRRVVLPAVATHAALIAFSTVMLFPFLFMVSTSLKYQEEMMAFPPTIVPNEINWTYYRAIFFGAAFGDKAGGYSSVSFQFYWFTNTALLVVLNVLGGLFTASLAAYAFARMRFRGRAPLFIVVLSTLMIPTYVTLIPTYIIWREFGVLNTYVPLVLPYLLGGGAFSIFLMRQFIMTLPHELDDAARIDGCGWFGVYARIVLPLMKAPLVAIAIFTFLGTYNDFLHPLIFLTDPALYPISVGLRLFGRPASFPPPIQAVMAASTVVMLPTVVVFLFTQRHFMQGLVVSGIKG